MSWLSRTFPGGSPAPKGPPPVDDFAPELIDAHKRIRTAKGSLRILLVRLSADRQYRDTDEYIDLALDIARALDGRAER